jgi:UDP-glucuronate decarboxylase
VTQVTNTSPEVAYLPLPQDDPRRRRPDIARATALLGWSPTVSIRDGLEVTARWFAEEVGAELPSEARAAA